MNNLGKPLLIIGVVILIVAFNMDVSVQSGYGRVNNIGLMADRSNYLFFGALLCVAGLILTARNRTTQPGEVSVVSDERKCPFCAEMIKKEAKLCKHCKCEVPLIGNDDSHQFAADTTHSDSELTSMERLYYFVSKSIPGISKALTIISLTLIFLHVETFLLMISDMLDWRSEYYKQVMLLLLSINLALSTLAIRKIGNRGLMFLLPSSLIGAYYILNLGSQT